MIPRNGNMCYNYVLAVDSINVPTILPYNLLFDFLYNVDCVVLCTVFEFSPVQFTLHR